MEASIAQYFQSELNKLAEARSYWKKEWEVGLFLQRPVLVFVIKFWNWTKLQK